MTGLHDSTLALSVYNVLARCGSLNRDQIRTVLAKVWHKEIEADEVGAGVSYLMARKFVTEADGIIAPARAVNGAAATVIRNPLDQTELAYSRKQTAVKDGARLDA